MRRLLWVVLAAGAACSDVSKVEPGPTDGFYRPMGIGVYAGKLVVASSNADLRYDSATGGSVISVDPVSGQLRGGLNIESFAGQMAVAEPSACAGIGADGLALVPVRGADLLYLVQVGAGGGLTCNGCGVALGGKQFVDAFSVGVACSPAIPATPTDPGAPAVARAYVGYLRAVNGQAWISEVDLASRTIRSSSYGIGQMLGFAYDAERKRLYAAQSPQGIRWIDLAGDCHIDVAEVDGGCHGGATTLPPGLEAYAIALSTPDPAFPVRRLYVLARVFDAEAASSAGVRAGDVDTLLLVTELAEDLAGQMQVHVLKEIPVGYGPAALKLLPARAGRRDIVAALAGDDPVLLLYDDDTDARFVVGRDGVGHAWVGSQPFGLAVDPVPAAGVAHVYVGSFLESFVTQIDVPLAEVNSTSLTPSGGLPRFRGGTP